jgi:hypothetical protein
MRSRLVAADAVTGSRRLNRADRESGRAHPGHRRRSRALESFPMTRDASNKPIGLGRKMDFLKLPRRLRLRRTVGVRPRSYTAHPYRR